MNKFYNQPKTSFENVSAWSQIMDPSMPETGGGPTEGKTPITAPGRLYS